MRRVGDDEIRIAVCEGEFSTSKQAEVSGSFRPGVAVSLEANGEYILIQTDFGISTDLHP